MKEPLKIGDWVEVTSMISMRAKEWDGMRGVIDMEERQPDSNYVEFRVNFGDDTPRSVRRWYTPTLLKKLNLISEIGALAS